jgi:hypothetical protein
MADKVPAKLDINAFRGSWNGLSVHGDVTLDDDGEPVLTIEVDAGEIPVMKFGITSGQARQEMQRILNLAAPMLHELGDDFKVWLKATVERMFPRKHAETVTTVGGFKVPRKMAGRLPVGLRTKIIPND